MADPTAILLAVSLGGAALAGWLTPRRPLVAFGVLFLLASLTRPTVETPLGTMRLEQPAIAVVGIVLLWTGRLSELGSLPRWTWVMAGCLAVYLGVLALSSAFIAPDPIASLRIVMWWIVSMASGVIAILLVGQRGREAIVPLGLVGAATAIVGLATAFDYLVLGPSVAHGIQEPETILPRVYGLAHEANIYASFLAACAPFGLEMARSGRDRRLGIVVAGLILLGLPLGMTRGAYLGLATGVVVYLGVFAWRDRRRLPALAGLAAATVFVTVVGVGAANVLLPDPFERIGPPVTATPSATTGSQSPGGTGVVGVTPTPRPTLRPFSDTLAYRMERAPLAVADMAQSPIVGLGAESFGQRHLESQLGSAPDHIAILVIAVPYESGLIGSVALTAAFVIFVIALWRASRRSQALGPAAAYLASVATLFVAFVATNALHFATNWLIIGAAVALAARPPGEPDREVPDQPPSARL